VDSRQNYENIKAFTTSLQQFRKDNRTYRQEQQQNEHNDWRHGWQVYASSQF